MKITCNVDIDCTPETVWYWLGTPERAMVWQKNVSKTEVLHETKDMVGTTFKEIVEEGGRGTELHGIITGYKENQLLAMHLDGKYNNVDVQWKIEIIGEFTRLIVTADVRFKSVLKLAGVLLRKNIIRQFKSELATLKELCENEQEATQA